MSLRRRIDIYFDTEANMLRDSAGNSLLMAYLPYITFREKIIINLQLVTDSDLTVYDRLDTNMTFEAAIDYAFQSSQLMSKTLNSGFNVAADWDDGDTADVTAGELSIKMNGSTTGFETKIGTNASLSTTKFELKIIDANNNLYGRYEFPFITKGLISDGDALPDQETENFQWFTDPNTGAKCLRIVNDDGEVLQVLHPMGV